MKFNFNPFKKLVTGAAILTAGPAVAEKAPALTPESNPSHQTEVFTEAATTTENNSEVVNFNAERQSYLEKLQTQKTGLETHNQREAGDIDSLKNDFVQRYVEALNYLGHKTDDRIRGEKPHKKITLEDVRFLPDLIQTLTEKMGEEYVEKQDITSKKSLDGLMGILMAYDGPLGEYAQHLDWVTQQQIGSLTHVREHGLDITDNHDASKIDREQAQLKKTGGKGMAFKNEDTEQREALHGLLKQIVQKQLAVVAKSHELKEVIAKQEMAKGDTTAQGGVASVTF